MAQIIESMRLPFLWLWVTGLGAVMGSRAAVAVPPETPLVTIDEPLQDTVFRVAGPMRIAGTCTDGTAVPCTSVSVISHGGRIVRVVRPVTAGRWETTVAIVRPTVAVRIDPLISGLSAGGDVSLS